MPMNAYTGATGAGKTYQVMEHLVCVELAQGRSIVTNIEGIDVDGIYWYILCKNRGKKERVNLPDGRSYERDKIVCLGSLRHIKDDEIEKAGEKFFPYIHHVDGEKIYDDSDSVIKNGEYIIIDEAPNWWGIDCKISRRHGQFFREHRHFTNPITCESCDIVFLTQDVAYLHTSLRRKGGIRYTFWIEKMDMVGMVKRYKMLMYRGTSMTKNTKPERIEHGSYKEEVYLLYDSYAKGKGKEKIMDSRQNVLNNKKKWRFIAVVAGLFLIVAYFMVQSLIAYFHPAKKDDSKKMDGAKGAVVFSPPKSLPPQLPESDWKVSGDFRIGYDHYVVISRAGRLRTLINPRGFYYDGLRASGSLDGNVLANYTGQDRSTMPGEVK